MNRTNYANRTAEGRNKKLIPLSEQQPRGRPLKIISDDEILKQYEKLQDVKKRGRSQGAKNKIKIIQE